MFENVLLEVMSLVGFSALASLIVNVLKLLHVVQDGTADKWVAGINAIGVVALYVVRLFIPEFAVAPIDSVLYEVAVVGGFLMTYVGMLWGSKFTYTQTRGLPGIGKSFSQ